MAKTTAIAPTRALDIRLGIWAILVASILWGTTGTVASFGIELSPLTIGAIATGGGGLLQAILAYPAIKKSRNVLRQHPWFLFLGMLSVATYPLAFYSSMYFAGVTIGTVVSIGIAPLFSALFEIVFEKKPLSKLWLISSLIGILGITLLALAKAPATETFMRSDLDKIIGISLGVLAGFTYALYSWIAKQLITAGVHSKAAMGSLFGLSAMLLIPLALITGSGFFNHGINTAVALYMVLVPMFLGYLLFAFGLQTISTSRAVTLTLFEPFVATLLAIIVVGERLTGLGIIGLIAIFISIALLSRPEPSRASRQTS